MTHLTPDELADAAEGTLTDERRRHLDTCAACAHEAAQLSAVLREARDVGVPEPSPLFWDHFSARVRAAVQAEPAPGGGGWSAWLKWPVLMPLGAMALLVLALVVAVPRQVSSPSPPTAPVVPAAVPAAVSAEAMLFDDGGWVLVTDLMADIDWETASQAGLIGQPGSAERAALELSAQEQQELGRLLKAELERAKS